MTVPVGTVHVQCPECEQIVQVPVTAEIVDMDDGRQNLVCESDMTDLWAHTWTHEEGSEL